MKKKNFTRAIRVSQELKKEISIILMRYIKDPRINFLVTISMVRVSRDLSCAKIFFSYLEQYSNAKNFFNSKYKISEILNILQNSSNYIRKLLYQRFNLRKIPILYFYHDSSLLTGMKISNIIKSSLKNNKNNKTTSKSL
ncbi:30S ribosome-binding factor [Buchnera aphidicola (Symydobius americanus)]